MDKVILTQENIGQEHICCAMSDKKSAEGVEAKKEWLACRMEEGLKFVKLNVRGKVFIEYLPAEYAWVPIEADGYTFINCLWVAGSFKGLGYGRELLKTCEEDVAGTNGVAVMVGKKKLPYLSDKAFFIRHGYEVCDSCVPNIELLVKRFRPDAPFPRFKSCASVGLGDDVKGIDIFYTAQCPFTVPYIKLLDPVIQSSSVPVRVHPIMTREMARDHRAPLTTYSVFVDGKFYTREVLTPAKLQKLLEEQ